MIKTIAQKLPRFALVLALLLPVWFLVASLGAKLGVIDKMFAFGTMTATAGPIMAAIVAVLALIALIASLLIKPRRGWVAALIGLAIPLAIFAGFNALREQAASVPFIYDITTNPADAPAYSAAMMSAREGDGANALIDFDAALGSQEKWEGMKGVADKTAAQLIASGYPDLETLETDRGPADVLKVIEDAMEMRGFNNVTADSDAGTVEGTDELFWYGFRDDVVARVRETETGTSVDFRSTSRLGTSDLGVNAERIADLMQAVKDRLERDFTAMADLEPDAEPIMVEETSADDAAAE